MRARTSSIGHQSGRHIIEIERGRSSLTEDDRAHMRKVVAYIKRHLAQRPHHDVEHTRWRYSLMNWGHDPLKGSGPPADFAPRFVVPAKRSASRDRKKVGVSTCYGPG